MFTYRTVIRVRDADPGGVLFFGRYFGLAHDALEAMMAARGAPYAAHFTEKDYVIPVVHAESDHRAPLEMGEEASVSLELVECGTRRFAISHTIKKADGRVACTIKTAHVAVSKQTGRVIKLPEEVVQALNRGRKSVT